MDEQHPRYDEVECSEADLTQQSLDDLIQSLTAIRGQLGGSTSVYAVDWAVDKQFMRITPTLDDAGEVVLRLREY